MSNRLAAETLQPVDLAQSHDRRPQHILTVALEDYYQVGAFRRYIDKQTWHRFEPRLTSATEKTLALLERHHVKATFFVHGWTAEHYPELVKHISASGHEIASRGYWHRGLAEMTRQEFHDDALRARQILQDVSGQPISGYRMADGWLTKKDRWVWETLQQVGHQYDSSVCPHGLFPQRGLPIEVSKPSESLPDFWIIPLSTTNSFLGRWPIAGGNWARQFPKKWLKRGLSRWTQSTSAPLVLYFHTWELDEQQPQLSAASSMTKLRHYRNLSRVEPWLTETLSQFAFGNVTDVLGIEEARQSRPNSWLDSKNRISQPLAINSNNTIAEDLTVRSSIGEDLPELTIVIPCFNEAQTVPYLTKTLLTLANELSRQCRPTFLFVDDCSTDETWSALHQAFSATPLDVKFVQHATNRGVAAAILTGIRESNTEYIASMDCDCSYDPHELVAMFPLIAAGNDLVTASPYHPRGTVRNVPGWRLLLSKGLSRLYRIVLKSNLNTFTSCFRLYRRSRMMNHQLTTDGFLGIAELLCLAIQAGQKVAEHPAELSVRLFGESKMKTLRTIRGHLKLLARMYWRRLRGKTQNKSLVEPLSQRSPQQFASPTSTNLILKNVDAEAKESLLVTTSKD